jgi:transposase
MRSATITIGISISRESVKELVKALYKSYKRGDVHIVKRLSALLSFSRGETMDEVAESLGIDASSVYRWVKELLVEGIGGLKPRWKGGRPPKLSPSAKKRLAELIDVGPEAAGFRTACWKSVLIQELIQREFHILYYVHYLCELLKNLGVVLAKLYLPRIRSAKIHTFKIYLMHRTCRSNP